jgi:hypothetical protein
MAFACSNWMQARAGDPELEDGWFRVLMVMANDADRGNERIAFSGVSSVATRTGKSSKAKVRRAIAFALERGWLVEVVGPAARRSASYLFAQVGHTTLPSEGHTTLPMGHMVAREGNMVSREGNTTCPDSFLDSPLDSEKEKTREREVSLSLSSQARGERVPPPDEFEPNAKNRAFVARKLGDLDEEALADLVNDFLSYNRDQGKLSADWQAAFHGYVKIRAEIAPRANANAGRGGERPARRSVSNEPVWVPPTRLGRDAEGNMRVFDWARYNWTTLEGALRYLEAAHELRRCDLLDGVVAEGERPAEIVKGGVNWWWHEHVERLTLARDAAAAKREAG